MCGAKMLAKRSMLMCLILCAPWPKPLEGQATAAEGKRLQSEGKAELARDTFEQTLLRDPTDPGAREGMSLTSERLALDQRAAGHMDDALASLLRAQRVEPDDKRILLDLGILEDEMSLYLDAASTLEHLQSLPPVDPNALYALARVNMSLGKLTEAEQEMQSYLAVHPQDASAHYGLGSIYLQGLQFDKAERELQQSIAIQPKQSEAYYQLGEAYLDQDRYVESIAEFEKVLERDPQHGGALAGVGIAYFKLKQYDKAKGWLLKSTLAAPDYQVGHYYLGLTLSRIGDAAGSQRELEIATALAAKDAKQLASRLRLNNPEGQP